MRLLDPKLAELLHVQKIAKIGYTIEYDVRNNSPHIDMRVFKFGEPAAHACFQFDERGGTQFTEDIVVYEGHRRQGIANALMVCSTHLTGCKPKPASGQTSDGRAWWGQPNRPW